MAAPSEQQLMELLRDRIAATVPEGTGAEIKNLVDAYVRLRGEPQEQGQTAQPLVVQFIGESDDYSL